MLTENFILLTAIRNPFDPYRSRITLSKEYKAQPLYMYMKDVLPSSKEEFQIIASVNGQIVDNDFIPLPNSSIVFTQVVEGGGGSNDALRVVASIAVLIVSYYVPGWLGLVNAAGQATGWGIAAQLGFAVGGSLLVNALLPIRTPEEEQASPSYSFGSTNVINEGAAFPVVYGTAKIIPPIIGIYSQNIWIGGYGTPDLQKINILYAIADHSVSSIGTIQINGSPYEGYDDVTVTTMIGGLSQNVIPNFMDTRTQQGYSILINKTNEWYGPYDVPGSNITAIGIGIGFPNGLGYWNNDGNVEPLTPNIQVQYRIKDVGGGTPGSWVDWKNSRFLGAEATALRYHTQTDYDNTTGWPDFTPYYSGVELTPDEYQVRFLSATGFSTDRRYVMDMYVDYIEGIVKDDFRYPGASLLALNAVATDQLSGGIPNLTCVVTRGNITVYEQDGTPHSVSSSNPAWVCYDILNNAEYGCNVSYTRINYSEFNAWATFCSTNSYTCNIIFDANMSVPDALAQVSVLGRGHVVQRGTNFGVVIDKTDTPVQMFTMGNIIEDTLNISYIAKKDRVNAIETTYYDSTDDYDARSFELRTSDFDTNTDIEENKMTLDLRGCTNKDQALKLTKFLMNCNEYLIQTAEFEVQVDSLASNVGDVILVSHDVPDWGFSGHVVSATSNTVVIDHEVQTESSTNYKCIVRHKADDSLEEVALVNPLGTKTDTFTLTGTWSVTPSADDLYIIGITNQSYRDFRITRISRTQEMRRKITALEYNAGVYSDSVNVADYEEQPHLPEVYSGSVNAYEIYRKESGIMKTIIAVTWRGYGGLFYLYVKEETADRWRLINTYSYSMSAEWKDSEPGKTYIFAVSTTPNPGDGETVTITVAGYTYNPPRVIWPVTGLEVFGQGNNTIWQNRDLKLRWNIITSTFPTTAGSETTGAGAYPALTEFGGYRLRISDQNGNLRREIIQIENTYIYTRERNSEDGYMGRLYFSEETGGFVKGEMIYQYPSGASAMVNYIGTEYIGVTNIVGTFVSGQIIYHADYGSELLTNGDFTNWTGDNPDGWNVYFEDANNYATESSGQCRIVSNYTTGIQIVQAVLTQSHFFLVSIDCTDVTTGALSVYMGNDYKFPINSVQTYSGIYQSGAYNTSFVIVRSNACDVTFDNVSVKKVINAAIASEAVVFESKGTTQDAEPNLIIQVWARDKYGQESENPAILSVSNPAPSAPSGLTLISSLRGVTARWQKNTEIDFSHYRYRTKVETDSWSLWKSVTNTETTRVLTDTEKDTHGFDATIYFEVIAVDTFGNASSASSGSKDATGLYISPDDIQTELFGNLELSDSDSNIPATLAKLYDNVTDSDGVSYTVSGTDKYIEYSFPIQTLVDRVAAWADGPDADVYVAYSNDGGSTWSYLKAEADHTLDSEGKLLNATNPADAQANYWSLSTGKNVGIFPNGLVADRMRLYLIGSWTETFYELVFVRQVLAEQVVADQLSAITAALGSVIVTSGEGITVQSGGGITIESGGDITLESSVSNTSFLIWPTTSINIKIGADYDLNSFVIFPDTDGSGTFIMGVDFDSSTQKRFNNIFLTSKSSFKSEVLYDGTHYSRILLDASSGAGNLEIDCKGTTNQVKLNIDASSTLNQVKITGGHLASSAAGTYDCGTGAGYWANVRTTNIYRDNEYALSCLPDKKNIYVGPDAIEKLKLMVSKVINIEGMWGKTDPNEIPLEIKGPVAEWGELNIQTIDGEARIAFIVSSILNLDERLSLLEKI